VSWEGGREGGWEGEGIILHSWQVVPFMSFFPTTKKRTYIVSIYHCLAGSDAHAFSLKLSSPLLPPPPQGAAKFPGGGD